MEEKTQDKTGEGILSKIPKSLFRKDRLLIGLLTGVLLLTIAWPTGEEPKVVQKKTKEEGVVEKIISETEQEAYTRNMEERLSYALSRVEGVGEAHVLITWKSSGEKVVEKDEPRTNRVSLETDESGGSLDAREQSVEENTVFQEEEDGSRVPYVVKELRPEAEGVLVVAEGGGNARVVKQILEAVQALFPLEAHKIKIMKMEGST